MDENKEYTVSEDTSQSTQDSGGLNIVAGTNAAGFMGGSVVKEAVSQSTIEKEGKPSREEVIKDVNEKFKSIDKDNVEGIVNGLMKKYFDGLSSSLVDRIHGIKRSIKWGFLSNKKDLKYCFRRLIDIVYPPKGDTNVDNGKDQDKEKRKEEAKKARKKIDKDKKDLSNAQKKSISEIPAVLTEHSGNFKSWNELKFKSKDLSDTSGLGRYQEAIKKEIDSENTLTKQAAYQKYDSMIRYGDFQLADAMTYASIIGVDIEDYGQFKCFIGAVCGEIPNVAKQKPEYLKKYDEYKRAYEAYYQEMIIVEDEIITQIYTESLTARYETATSVAEGRNFYESDFINFTVSNTEQQGQSGLQVASNIDNISEKLNHYKFNTNKSEHEEAALKYTAFDITFKNIFNLTNPIIEKLGAQQVDLRNDLFKYGIYNQDSNTFNQSARDKYVAEKLTPLGFAPEEVKVLLNAIIGLPAEVEKNYEILSGNFNTDQDNFEKIAKIYALGEVIDNIKDLFTNGDILSDNEKLGAAMGFEFDENSADIVGDCLILKGRANGTETKIKYDLRTGKLYMNSFTQIELNPPKITVGNKEPNTEIGDLGNFNDLLEGYQPTSFTQTDKVDYSEPSNNMANGDDAENMNSNDQGNKDSNQKTLEKLMENKLLGKLSEIGNIVKEKAGEQSGENNVIDEFLRTFNILPNNSNQNTSGTIEFTGGFNSNLFILLNSIKDTDKQDELTRFSNAMKELMSYCGLFWGNNNLESKGNEFSSFTIFDIDEKNATQDIISLQKANQSFFSDTGGEKDRIKGCESHFDASVKLSFANIIVQKCCRRSGGSWKVSADLAEEFVNSIKKGIEDIKHDESDVVAMENMIEDESMWA